MKTQICKAFETDVDLSVDGANIDRLILQCDENLENAVFYYDCNPYNIDSDGIDNFFTCVEKSGI